MNKTVSVVVVTYNGISWIDDMMRSVPNEFEVIIVDNNSKDNTIHFIETNYPKAKIIKKDKNLGFGGGNNIGISYALKNNSDYVLLLNQDAYLYPETIPNLIESHLKNPNFGILSPIHINKNENSLDRNFSKYIGYDRNPYMYFDALNKRLKNIYEVPFINAACWLIPKNVFETVGGFDPVFFHYGEDDNFCHRLKYHGYKVGVVTNSLVIHDREQSRVIDPNTLSDIALLKAKKKDYKVNYCNILNENFPNSYVNKISYLKRQYIKSILKLNFRKSKLIFKELKFLKDIEEPVLTSRNTNKRTGLHYLPMFLFMVIYFL